jgi:hypothetical protein
MARAGRHDRTMADEPTPRDMTPPDLTDAWHDGNGQNWVPPMDGNVRGQPPPAATDPPKQPPVVQKFHVAPSSLESASKDMLAAASDAVNAYTTVQNYMAANKSWVFSVSKPENIDGYTVVYINDTATVEPYHDPHPDWTAQWSAGIDNLLLASADVVKLASDFLDAINNAGEFYVKSDKDSVMPQLGT